MNHDSDPDENRKPTLKSNWILLGFLLVAGYFLVMEHQAHLSGVLKYLPFLLLLLCPLMHFFMHGSHGGHGDREKRPRDDAPRGDGK